MHCVPTAAMVKYKIGKEVDAMETMKAWVLREPQKLELCSVPVPQPGCDEVLIRVEASCLCNGSDPGIYRGHEAYTTPFVFGHESSGIIVKAGEDTAGFRVGDRVSFWCATGAFAEYQAVSPRRVAMFRVPERLTIEETPILELVIASCRSLMRFPPVPGRRKLCICGLGPSGLVLTQYARLLGYEKITGWDLYPNRRELAVELGADAVYDPSELSREKIAEMELSDISVVMMGDDLLKDKSTVTNLMRATAVGGTVVSYGHPENGMCFSPFVFQSRDLTMVGPSNDMELIRTKGQEIMEALEQGKIRIAPLITHRLKFEDIGAAMEQLLRSPEKQIKAVFTL